MSLATQISSLATRVGTEFKSIRTALSTKAEIYSGTTATAAATAAKTVTVTGYTPVTGDLLRLTFTSGNTVASMTLSVNGGAAKAIRVNNTATSTVTATLVAGATLLLMYDGTYWQMMGTQRLTDSDTTYAEISSAEITAGTASTVRSISGRRAQEIITKALTSPALTGTPTAPTQTPGTNNTRIATTAYADASSAAAVSGKVSGTGITSIVALTQAAYDALGTPVATTLYVITD